MRYPQLKHTLADIPDDARGSTLSGLVDEPDGKEPRSKAEDRRLVPVGICAALVATPFR